ncbi:MAG TPA: wax ester/triacylglycerol synthase family O-acyltransferase [Alphaproteobacteria bacterium]|nr:wax ester/triacylglycerol synthase family O-acyltransferase [Alphaproteobacteria bacterium]
MSDREPMSPVDTTWLRMDRPHNLMMIVAVWVLEGPVALDRLENQLAERYLTYRRYRQKVEFAPGGPYWVDDPLFDLAHHIKRLKLPGRGGKDALQRFVGDLASEPVDFNHPLWTVHIVEDYERGAAVVFRIHHAMGDGVALMGVTMALVDGPVGESRRAPPPDEGEGWLQTLMAPVVAAVNAGTQATSALGAALDFARHPLRAIDYLRDGAGVAGELAYMLSMKSDSATRFKGKPIGSKRVAWCEPLKLPEVKAVSRALGCTINDMLLSCAAGAMRGYLADKGDRTQGVEVGALVPIDLREPGDVSLGNRFGVLTVFLPVGIEHPLERLMTVRQRMLELKTSYEPATTLGLFAALGYLPKTVQDQLLDLLAGRSTAVMTNVPGPTEPLKVAGSILKQSLFWVPQTGDVGMGVSIFSYAGQVQFGLTTDAALTPDPEAVVSRFPEEFEKYLYYVLLDPPPVEEEPATGETASRPRLQARADRESA